jgi:hypothetical protein
MKKRKSFVILFIWFAIINLLNCDTQSKSEADKQSDEGPKCCDNSTSERLIVEFSSSTVEHEYIIHFKNYYKEDTRRKYIISALDNNSEVIDVMLSKQNVNSF